MYKAIDVNIHNIYGCSRSSRVSPVTVIHWQPPRCSSNLHRISCEANKHSTLMMHRCENLLAKWRQSHCGLWCRFQL